MLAWQRGTVELDGWPVRLDAALSQRDHLAHQRGRQGLPGAPGKQLRTPKGRIGAGRSAGLRGTAAAITLHRRGKHVPPGQTPGGGNFPASTSLGGKTTGGPARAPSDRPRYASRAPSTSAPDHSKMHRYLLLFCPNSSAAASSRPHSLKAARQFFRSSGTWYRSSDFCSPFSRSVRAT